MTLTTSANVHAIGFLILARLLPLGENGDTGSKIKKDLEPLLAHRWQGAALAEQLDRTLIDLESRSLVTAVPGRTRKSEPKFALTAEGRRQALEFLGVAQLRPKTTWAVLRKTYLPARALGLPAATDVLFKAFSSAPAFEALLLKQQFDLTTAEIPKLDEATDALAWKLIGFEGENRKFNPRNVKVALFNHALGDGRAVDVKRATSRLLAQRVGARRDDPKEVRDAVLRGWIDQEERGSPCTTPLATPHGLPSHSPVAPALDLPSFAEQVKSAARDCLTGRFGDNKVFIGHVWKALQGEPAFRTMTLTSFKERLAEANNGRLLNLSRADLVQAMDINDVRDSEVRYLNATFHFVRI